MAWPSLVVPTPGTVITTAWESAMVNDPLLWLRLMTGNADPPGSSYVVVSSSPTSTAWGKVPRDALALEAVGTPQLAPLAVSADRLSPGVGLSGSVLGMFGAALGWYTQASLAVGSASVAGSAASATNATNATNLTGGGSIAASTVTGNLTFASGRQMNFASENANKIDLSSTGNYVIAVANNTLKLVTAQFVEFWNAAAGGASGRYDTTNHSFTINGQRAWHAGDFAQPTATPTASRVPIADASGKLDAWVTPTSAAPVPSGLIAFIADANLPTGWSFWTNANGRVIVGAGATGLAGEPGGGFGVNGQYGASWTHAHTVDVAHQHAHSTTHNHGAVALGVSGHVGTPSAVNGLAAPGGTNLPTDTHTHDASAGGGTLDVTGTTDTAAPGVTDVAGSTTQGTTTVTYIPPSYALNCIRKN